MLLGWAVVVTTPSGVAVLLVLLISVPWGHVAIASCVGRCTDRLLTTVSARLVSNRSRLAVHWLGQERASSGAFILRSSNVRVIAGRG